MHRPSLTIGLIAFFVAILSFVAPAEAQATRTWISGVGDDANPCSRTAPCKTFAGAISKTAAGGEINVLDPGGFGGVTITKAITLRADHVEAGVLVAGTPGITVAAGPSDTVVIEGLDIDGTSTGTNGVSIISGLQTYVLRCAIRRFTQNGVSMTSSTSGARLFVRDSFINLNAGGVYLQGSGVANTASIVKTELDGNANFALEANGAGNVFDVSNSVLNASSATSAAIILMNRGSAVSFGPSNVVSGTGAFTTTSAFQ